MKSLKKILVVLLLVVMVVSLASCRWPWEQEKNPGGGGGGGGGGGTNKELTPADIKKIADITNYGNKTEHYRGATVTYNDITAEVEKLQFRIDENKEDVTNDPDNASSITKIFANSDAEAIIGAMEDANLPEDLMEKTVDYMAGDESLSVSEQEIQSIVDTGNFNKNNTTGWSFFDDWSYYEKLQDRADASGNTNDEDNVKRQYRNMMGKVFEIGMSGDQFARVAVHELVYGTSVVEVMAGADLSTGNSITSFDSYCQEELDYETLVYLRAFNENYQDGAGLQKSVQLYGYYYEYNRTDYYSQTDDEFELQLKYGHQDTFTNAEWTEYVKLQRESYVKAYRYSDKFYETFYGEHFAFQTFVEKHEEIVYNISKWNNKTYTSEMQKAVQNSNLIGQLNFTDWLWCYGGDSEAMKEYNDANTEYQNTRGDNASAEAKYNAEFDYDMVQLKAVYYILNNMSNQNLGRTLTFQVYSYSGEMVKSAQGYNKDITLVKDDRIVPEDAIRVLDTLDDAGKKEYAIGKIEAMLGQMNTAYSNANVTSSASNASTQPWDSIESEVKAAIEKDYSSYSGKDKIDALEDMVIKRKYDCGGTEETCGVPGNENRGHVGCVKEYDTSHKISQFVSSYEPILRHMAGSITVSFMNDAKATTQNPNNYKINEYPIGSKTFTSGFKGTLTADMVKVDHIEVQSWTVSSGKTFLEGIEEDAEDWWNNTKVAHDGSRAEKKESTGNKETNPQTNVSGTYSYTYTFTGWYLDAGLEYLFDAEDVINCDLTLYAGYDVVKKG